MIKRFLIVISGILALVFVPYYAFVFLSPIIEGHPICKCDPIFFDWALGFIFLALCYIIIARITIMVLKSINYIKHG
jgi:hypothetical protein